MARWFRNASFLLLAGASFGSIGFLGKDLDSVLTLLAFLVFAGSFLPRTFAAVRRSRLPVALLVGALGIVCGRFAGAGLFHSYLFVFIAILVAIYDSSNTRTREFAIYVLAYATVGILAELTALFPVLWHLKMAVASVLSRAGELLAREDRNLGATAIGLPILVSLLTLAIVRELSIAESRRSRLWLVLGVIVATHLFYVVLLKYYAQWLARHPGRDWLLLNSQHLFLLLGATVYTLADRPDQTRGVRLEPRRRLIAGCALSFSLPFLVAALFGWAPSPRHGPAKVMIYDAGYLDWKVPVHGVYGERSAGMFGLLPSAMQALGFDTIVSKDLGVLDGPDAPGCVIMINIQKFILDDDKRTIWRYVARGGGLLCLGDHTGVAGIRGPFNDLLAPVGIRFKFDSSTFFGEGWNDALELRVHPMNRAVRSAEDYQIWVGATLDTDVAARPVVVARYGYSDIGDPANIERSYLGDRRYNPNELLGDVVLVADARYGKGRVMVFGDTSGYQNLSLARSLDTVTSSIDYLAAPGGWWPSIRVQLLAILVLVLLLRAAIEFTKSPVPLLAASFGFVFGSIFVHLLTPPPQRMFPEFGRVHAASDSTRSSERRDVAVIDVSHGGYFTLRAWKENSLGGLQLNLARNGYFPLIRDEFPYRDLERGAKLFVCVAPSRGYSSREIDAVERFLRSGGSAIVSVGFEEIDGSRRLLQRFGIDVANVPLGRFEVKIPSDTLSVLVKEGWPVRCAPSQTSQALISNWGLPVAVRCPVGKGDLIVIGDSSFFHDGNLETLDHYFGGNIAFLSKITERRAPR